MVVSTGINMKFKAKSATPNLHLPVPIKSLHHMTPSCILCMPHILQNKSILEMVRRVLNIVISNVFHIISPIKIDALVSSNPRGIRGR